MDESDGKNSAILTDMQGLFALSDGNNQDNGAAVRETAFPATSDACMLVQEPCAATMQHLYTKLRPQLTVDTSRCDEPGSQSARSLSLISRTRDYCKKFWDWVILSNANGPSVEHEVKQGGEDVLSEVSDDSDYDDHLK